ncbi:hypothetical protein NL108_009415 [Boleophthalmus pectinirostris]|uniref:N-lysine methyltransferase KMT5A-A n=1 Tax=Boleophthalmus pectinirostris TaxID=150288 RepID=UPI00242A6E79|nr:N-lysine methyltransferase KMT5A-A [Boleophthalmus pectinirostris]KAJ0057619.1 hypothetical protein NL108_009415 [Boleophthalmus pectinirostris]
MNGEVVRNSHSITVIGHTQTLLVHDEKKINKEIQFSLHSQEIKESRGPKPFTMAAKDLSSDLTESSNCSIQRQQDVLSCSHPPSAVTALSQSFFYTNSNNNNNINPQGKHQKRRVYNKERRSALKSAPRKNSQNRKVTDYYPIRRSSRKSKTELQCEHKKHIDELIINGIEEGMEVQQIEGKGRAVFATRSFLKGEYVVEYHGDLLQITDAKKREAEYAQNPATGCYMYYFQYLCKTYCVDATKETGRMGRLINHSKNGNCQTKLHDINGVPHLILVASRNIDEGEELLYDYGDRSKASIAAHPWLKE